MGSTTDFLLVVLLVFLLLGVFGIFVYLGCRAVAWAKRRRSGGDIVAGFLGGIEIGGALNPAQEMVQEQRRLKRSEAGKGEPEDRDAIDTPEPEPEPEPRPDRSR